ncbi:MAG: type II secretion system protein [Betaproteobacteria bacterium]|nr:MAG: type II secretion system protein [Betaproteobacteria bacterium]
MASFSRQRGFTYLLVLFFLAVVTAGLAAVGELWSTSRQQERERELLFAGNAIRQAIGAYYLATPGPVKQYPAGLENLLKDPRFPDTRRYLRRVYPDPVADSPEWALIKAPQGGIMGIASASERAPLKRAGFLAPNQAFEEQAVRLKDKLRYRDWEFIYEPIMRRTSDQGAGISAP